MASIHRKGTPGDASTNGVMPVLLDADDPDVDEGLYPGVAEHDRDCSCEPCNELHDLSCPCERCAAQNDRLDRTSAGAHGG